MFRRARSTSVGSVAKGNTTLLDAANEVVGAMTEEDFNSIMNEAISVQPEI